ncbi:holo-ACP synthase [Calidifontibacillus oryziterrae]|uniref:holo-ACP synthase n=1 Tax=Calidifontibacillus oryziterrae TaxID=1191699 RepID=UPI0002F25960|nr:holo-ACP synthase [Calidifontibacillus oryziterrae]
MIKGIGIDIVEINRIHTILVRQPHFPNRILTRKELEIYEKLANRRQSEFLAGRFAAKEAFAKARGTGFGKQLSFLDLEILPDKLGKPNIGFKSAHDNLEEMVHLTITHSKEYAVAQVIIEKK